MGIFKKKPVLTIGTCLLLEKLRLAVEVWSGRRTRYVHVDLNTGNARFRSRTEGFDVRFSYTKNEPNTIFFAFAPPDSNLVASDFRATFTTPDEVVLSTMGNPVWFSLFSRGGFSMTLVGTSATNRWEVPVCPEAFAAKAKEFGMSSDQYLRSLDGHPKVS